MLFLAVPPAGSFAGILAGFLAGFFAFSAASAFAGFFARFLAFSAAVALAFLTTAGFGGFPAAEIGFDAATAAFLHLAAGSFCHFCRLDFLILVNGSNFNSHIARKDQGRSGVYPDKCEKAENGQYFFHCLGYLGFVAKVTGSSDVGC